MCFLSKLYVVERKREKNSRRRGKQGEVGIAPLKGHRGGGWALALDKKKKTATADKWSGRWWAYSKHRSGGKGQLGKPKGVSREKSNHLWWGSQEGVPD